MNARNEVVVRVRNGAGEVLTVAMATKIAELLLSFDGTDLRRLNEISDALEAVGLGDEPDDGGAA